MFDAPVDGGREIFATCVSGLIPSVQLTAMGGTNIRPIVSPDGAKLAWMHHELVWQIYEMDLHAGEVRKLSDFDGNNGEGTGAYSPDGQTMAYSSTEGNTYYDSDVWVRDLGTLAKTRVTDTGATKRWSTGIGAWSRDGDTLYYHVQQCECPIGFDVYSSPAEGSDAQRLTTHGANNAGGWLPQVSPSGRTLGFLLEADGTSHVCFLDLVTKAEDCGVIEFGGYGTGRVSFDWGWSDNEILYSQADGTVIRNLVTGSELVVADATAENVRFVTILTAVGLRPEIQPAPLSLTTTTATTMGATLPTERAGTSAVWTGSHAFVFGGVRESVYFDEIVRYDPASDTSVVMNAKLPTPRAGASAVWDGTSAYIFGGYDASTRMDEIVRYTPATNDVSIMTATLPTRREATSAVWDGRSAYVFGGRDLQSFSDEIVRFDPVNDSAAALSVRLPSHRTGTSAIWDGIAAHVFGGYDGTYLSEIVRFDPLNGSVAMTADLPSPRHGTSAAWDGSRAYVFGGDNPSRTSQIVELSTLTGSVAISPAALPSIRTGTSAVWAGTGAYVFGGYHYLDEIIRVAQDAELPLAAPSVCAETREDFDNDVFREGGSAPWSRSDASVTSGAGLLRVAPNGAYGDYAVHDCLATTPVSVDVRARLVNGGQGYVFPWLFFDLADGGQFVTTPLPGEGYGWRLQICGNWVTDCPNGGWTGDIPHPIASEGQFMTVRVEFGETNISVLSRIEASDKFELAATLDESVGAIRTIGIGQPWDPEMEVDYVSVDAVRGTAATIYEAAASIVEDGIHVERGIHVEAQRHDVGAGGATPPVASQEVSTPGVESQPVSTQPVEAPRPCTPIGCFGGGQVPSQDLGATPPIENRILRTPSLDPQQIPNVSAGVERGGTMIGLDTWAGFTSRAPIPIHADASPVAVLDLTLCPEDCPAPDASREPPTIENDPSRIDASVGELSIQQTTPSGMGGVDDVSTTFFGSRFDDDFESGSLDAWSVVWFQGSPYCENLNDWSVVDSPTITGNGTLRAGAVCDQNTLATNERIADLTRDFEFSMSFYFNDPASRGAQAFLWSGEDTGSQSDWAGRQLLVALERDPSYGSKFSLLNESVSIPQYDPGMGTISVRQHGSMITGYLNGEALITTNLTSGDREVEPYRLMLYASAAWGAPTEMFYDDVSWHTDGVVGCIEQLDPYVD